MCLKFRGVICRPALHITLDHVHSHNERQPTAPRNVHPFLCGVRFRVMKVVKLDTFQSGRRQAFTLKLTIFPQQTPLTAG